MTKNVKIASSRWSEAKTVTTSATTWGALKEELGTQVLNYEGSPMKTILRSSDGVRNTLVADDTLLPNGDFALLLVPEKVKSGDKIVYNSSVFKDMKTKMNKLFDFMIEATEKGGEMVFTVGNKVNETVETVDPLIQEAIEYENNF